MKSESNYDFLTGIFNKAYLFKKLDDALTAMRREGDLLSMLNVDIDFFAKYIESYGMEAGNNCLKTVADAVKSSLYRGDDFAARFDSDNFISVLPCTPPRGAMVVADRVLESVRKLQIPNGGSEVSDRLTISVGIVSCCNTQENVVSVLFDESKKALEQAKANGRDRYDMR